MRVPQFYIDSVIKRALREDINYIDAATDYLLPNDQNGSAYIYAGESGVLCGIDIALRVFEFLDPNIRFKLYKKDRDWIEKGDVIVDIMGKAAAILKGEDTALNLLSHLTGISTATCEAVSIVTGTNASIVDTMRTIPGLRTLQKYAVFCGGGKNHRINHSDGALIKRNHIYACGGIKSAITELRQNIGYMTKIEIVVETPQEAREAIIAGADILFLQKMNYDEMFRVSRMAKGRVLTEVSAGVEGRDLRSLSETGVDIISIASLTNSIKAFDVSMRMGIVNKTYHLGSKSRAKNISFGSKDFAW